ncbi:hypothetical protein HX13_04635 [Chryseobacterium sp. P1-3]|uniref:Uncharacterized protein n=1 Tax=Chryseobacterium gallinarum TaxID=1324352 RepID=A0A0G3M0P3_CHRGL|nr:MULTISPECIES: hypothetical protein [Chryseobacterium]AKK71538.1 hypothetical protein OK18_01785 [Chryseobacterium gallinarum]KFF75454.1 hypothetical protein HX13_04635 [Chryseobacterium sp. P1-3]MCL8538845.1 hypothetical protein [Chryseobacterium gallinarum]
MKNILSIISICTFSFLSAQTGINTDKPKATLDITAKKEVLTIDGLLPPRLTLAELTMKGNHLYGMEQDGIILYITNTSGGDKLSQREYIESKGLYIFDAEAANGEGRWMCLFCYGTL